MKHRLLQHLTGRWGVMLLLLLASPTLAYAQNTGKLSGRIIDASTGEGLPGATVMLEGTTLGTATDFDGNYFIIGIPVGTYDVQASFVGYQNERVTGVEISSGYTREIDFTLEAGVELDEIVVEYERPLIQKDAIGSPKIVSGEDIANLPVRGAAGVAAIQGGVVNQEGSSTLNVRGGRGSEVTYFIDGVKVVGGQNNPNSTSSLLTIGSPGGSQIGIPQSAIQEQEMLIGSISARYGDAMSGVINITTKSGSPQFFGTVEAITSQGLDSYGYSLGSASIGGPIINNKLSFFLAGEYINQQDSNPRAVGELYIGDDLLNNLRGAPQAIAGLNAEGNEVLMSIPRSVATGATFPVDNDGNIIVENGQVTLSDGTVVQVPDGVSLSPSNMTMLSRAEQLGSDDFSVKKGKRAAGADNLALSGNLTWNVFENGRLRVGGRYTTSEFDAFAWRAPRVTLSPEVAQRALRQDYQVYGTWTQYLSNSTFYQIQVDYSDRAGENWDPRFGTSFNDLLLYGDIDHAEYATLKGYMNVGLAEETRTDAEGNEITVMVPTLTQRYADGEQISSETTAGLMTLVGGRYNTFSQFHNNQFRLAGSATTQLGLHLVEFGAEYEQRTQRFWGINAFGLARYIADDNGPEGIAPDDPDLDPNGYTSYDGIPNHVINSLVTAFGSYAGYDIRGQNEVDGENFEDFLDTNKEKPLSAYNVAPYQPIYYGAYVQDKIEFRDIVLNLGLRVDVYDNNTRVFKDPHARRPVCRVGSGNEACPTASHPSSMGSDYAIYYAGDTPIGYRDLDGTFYDAAGQEVNAGTILLEGKPIQTNDKITPEMFEDYEPQVTWMPRIGVSFPVTDQALFFASYGIVSQRPSMSSFSSINALKGTGTINNNGLLPEKTTKYELGFRQRIGARSAFTLSGFFHQIDNLIQRRVNNFASPNAYTSFENVDFGTVKGFEFGYDLRRTNGVSMNFNYTLSFASGTASDINSNSNITWVNETPPNFISPLAFDQRHKLNLSIDYRLGAGEGPSIGGSKILQHFGFNVLATVGSGFPYTGVVEPFAVNASRAPLPSGGINQDRMPGQSRVDLRIDRRFLLGSGNSSLTAFFWVQNLFDQKNTNNAWRFTGLPDDDGFLSSAEGAQFLDSATPVAETAYQHRNRLLGNVGIPRMIRLGARLDF